LFGYYLAEGCIAENRLVIFTFNEKHEKYVKEIEKIILNYFAVNCTRKRTTGKAIQLQCCSKALVALLKFGCEKGSRKKEIPKEIFASNLKIKKGLLIGMYRGDGYFRNNRINYSTTSRKMIEGLDLILRELGIFGNIQKIQKTHVYNLNVMHRPLMEKLAFIYPKVKNLPKIRFTSQQRVKKKGKYYVLDLKKIKKITYGDVITLDTANHKYITSWGILTHNCVMEARGGIFGKCLAKDSAICNLFLNKNEFINTAIEIDNKYKEWIKK
jgi:intein/homing endonuclease